MPSLITFCEFMRTALYDAQNGYYATERKHFGREGDFYTINQMGSLFSQLMAERFAHYNEALDRPSIFSIVELGPGDGGFASHLLAEFRARYPELLERLRYVCCEISPFLRKQQQARLEEYTPLVTWITDLNELMEPVTGLFFSSEFFDALPVHVVRNHYGGMTEVYVEENVSGELYFREQQLSSPELTEYWNRVGAPLLEDQLAEINLEGVRWVREVSRWLANGWVITLDYGDLAGKLYTASRPEGTLRCFTRQQVSDSPLKQVGQQDLTASVNFSALIEYGRDAGLEFVSFERLSDYLSRNGLHERIARVIESPATGSAGDIEARLALKQLLVAGGLASDFKVLVQSNL